MRQKSEAMLRFAVVGCGQPKVVLEYQEKYKRLSDRLDEHPEVLTLVHRDLQKLSEGDGTGARGCTRRRTSCGPRS